MKQKDRGRKEHQHRYTSEEVAKMNATDRVVTVVGGMHLVRFVVQFGTCRHEDLQRFVNQFKQEGEYRRAMAERALANHHHGNGAWKPNERHCTPLLFPLPYIHPPTEIAHRFSNSEQEGGGVGK